MRVAVYARVSTADKDQEPETQLLPIRAHCWAEGWEIAREYVDKAKAQDLLRRTAWRALLDDAAKKQFDAVLVFKLDRAFRSVAHLHDTLKAWQLAGVEFISVREQFDTHTAMGRLLMNVLAMVAEFELELIRERVNAGLDRARAQGHQIGRPAVIQRPGFAERFEQVVVNAGLSKSAKARALGIGRATLDRLVEKRDAQKGGENER